MESLIKGTDGEELFSIGYLPRVKDYLCVEVHRILERHENPPHTTAELYVSINYRSETSYEIVIGEDNQVVLTGTVGVAEFLHVVTETLGWCKDVNETRPPTGADAVHSDIPKPVNIRRTGETLQQVIKDITPRSTRDFFNVWATQVK